MANCNYKVILKDIQNKYKFKIFCTGSGADLTNYYTKNETDTLLSGKVDSSKIVNATSTTAGETYDVRYINTMIGDIETILTTLDVGSGV